MTALDGFESREAEVKDQLRQLQERISLLKADVARSKLHNELLEQQRRQGLMEFVSERKKSTNLELQVETIPRELRGEADKYVEIANGAHKATQEAREETRFWKERFINLAWLASQAIMTFLKASEQPNRWSIHSIPPLRSQPIRQNESLIFASLRCPCKKKTKQDNNKFPFAVSKYLVIRKTKQPVLQYRYATRSRSRAMENMVEALEQQNQDLRGEILTQTNTAIIALANHNAAKHTQAGYAACPPPHNTRDPPYGMPYGWNTDNLEEREQQNAANNDGNTVPHGSRGQVPPSEEKWQSLDERLRTVEGGNRYGLEAVDLCLILDVGLPTDFKTPEFDKYKGSSCPQGPPGYDNLTRTTLNWYVSLERGRIKTWAYQDVVGSR
ncbi:hypothetical protein CR513_21283, partial [Mucuna pruriens]